MADSSPPRPVVICGPSGVGKGTLIELLQKSFPAGKFGFSVSHTTRKPREGEEDGVHYNFSTVDEIKAEIDAGKFVEYAEVHGNYYGTSVKAVESVQNKNLICLLDIDIQGAQNVKKSTLDAHYLFIAPPSMDELEKRLRGRGTESEEAIQKRLANAQGELDYGLVEGNFDAVLTNNDLEKTKEEMIATFKEWYPDLLGKEAPRPVVICGPSGVGKGTLIELLQKSFPSGKFGFSVSHTTRKPREGEENGVHYNFSTVDEMKAEIDDGKFIEHANVHGNYYGTSVEAVESVQNQNLICLLDIDIQGAQNVKKSPLDAHYLFIAPPSMEELEKRLRGRGTESEEAIQKRLANAQGEMDYGMVEGNFDAVLMNNDLEKTKEEMIATFKRWYEILDAEKTAEPQDNSTNTDDLQPPFVDPLSFPKTDEGLTALLTEIDKDCPLDTYVRTDLCYQASNVHVGAGKKLDITLPPVEQDGSKIEWTITLIDEYNEGLDIEFGLFVTVDGEEVVAREKGRILSPTLDASSSAGGEKVSAKGKFTVANSAPVTVVIKLDNSYAWIKPKKISYSFKIVSPVDKNMIERSVRAKSVLPKILEGKKALSAAKERETSRTEALSRIQTEMQEKMIGLNKQIVEDKQSITSLQKRAEEAEEEAKVKATEIKEALALVKKEEQSIEECTSAIFTLEEECAKLKKKWEELKIERQAREDEKVKLEAKAEETKEARVKLQEEIAEKKIEEQTKATASCEVNKEKHLVQDNLQDLEKEIAERKTEEDKYSSAIKFLHKQEEAVKLRFIETKH